MVRFFRRRKKKIKKKVERRGQDRRMKSAVRGDKAWKTGQQGEFKMRQTIKKNRLCLDE